MATKPLPTITPSVEARFWARVDKTPGHGPNGDCWVWTGKMNNSDGKYPASFSITVEKRAHTYRGSHIALATIGSFKPSEEMMALHSCDNPPCVNPAHLRWGTERENLEDYIARRKHARSFSPDEVRFIRSSDARHVDLARQYGVTSACILNIRKRVTHKHVE